MFFLIEMKATITGIWNSVSGFHRLNIDKERISELEYRSEEIIKWWCREIKRWKPWKRGSGMGRREWEYPKTFGCNSKRKSKTEWGQTIIWKDNVSELSRTDERGRFLDLRSPKHAKDEQSKVKRMFRLWGRIIALSLMSRVDWWHVPRTDLFSPSWNAELLQGLNKASTSVITVSAKSIPSFLT